jgi:tetratricopeptide (TPR) repeat protein
MSEHGPFQVTAWLREGISAAKAGKREEARELLLRVIDLTERNEQAWVWLSSVVDSDEDRLICLKNVLTLNPGNALALAGVRWLRERQASVGLTTAKGSADVPSVVSGPFVASRAQSEPRSAAAEQEPDPFMTPDGCVYCGLPAKEADLRCPHCGGRLATKQFKRTERSPTGYLLHVYWVLLAGIDVTVFVLSGYVWNNPNQTRGFIGNLLPYIVGPVVMGKATVGTLVEPDIAIQIVRLALLGLAAMSVLVASGLFLRRPLAHALGLVLLALHTVVGLALFVLGFLGYLVAAFLGLLIAMLTMFMFNTIEDFSKEERRERLEPDRHVRNDADYYARGRLYGKRGMWAKALLHWRRAVAINPERDAYFAAMAQAYAHLQRYENALEQVDAALRVSPTPQMWQPLRDIILEEQRRAVGSLGPPTRRSALD